MNSINILGRIIPIYGLMIVISVFVGMFLAYILLKNYKLNYFDYLLGFSYCLAFGMLGAKLLYLIVECSQIDWFLFFGDYSYFMNNLQGGFVFYGGVFGFIFGAWLAHKVHKIDTIKIISVIVPTFPLMHGIGRIGCHCVGCCYGIPFVHDFLSVVYYSPNHPMRGVPLFPVQLLEAILNFCLSFLLFLYLRKNGISRKNIYAYLIGYSIIRFFTEFLRFDKNRGILFGISISQYISLLIILVMFVFYIIKKRRNSYNINN